MNQMNQKENKTCWPLKWHTQNVLRTSCFMLHSIKKTAFILTKLIRTSRACGSLYDLTLKFTYFDGKSTLAEWIIHSFLLSILLLNLEGYILSKEY